MKKLLKVFGILMILVPVLVSIFILVCTYGFGLKFEQSGKFISLIVTELLMITYLLVNDN